MLHNVLGYGIRERLFTPPPHHARDGEGGEGGSQSPWGGANEGGRGGANLTTEY